MGDFWDSYKDIPPLRPFDSTYRYTDTVVTMIQKGGSGGSGGGKAIAVVVVDNGEFKTGDFYIKGTLTTVVVP